MEVPPLPTGLIDKHLNSKLYQKFLQRKPNISPKRATSPQVIPRVQPVVRLSLNPLPRATYEKSPPRATYQETVEQALKTYFQHELETQRSCHLSELGQTAKDFTQQLLMKSEEIERLKTQYESVLFECSEAKHRLEASGEASRKLKTISYDNKRLGRENQELHEQNQQLRRAAETLRTDLDTAKLHLDGTERLFRGKVTDLERQLRAAADRTEDLDRQAARQAEKSSSLKRKLQEKKEKIRFLTDELALYAARTQRQDPFKHAPPSAPEPMTQHLAQSYPPLNSSKSRVFASNSSNVKTVLSWVEQPQPDRRGPKDPQAIQRLESQLRSLSKEKQRWDKEYGRLPPRPKKASELHQKEEVERELNLVNSNISTVKSQLRRLGAFS